MTKVPTVTYPANRARCWPVRSNKASTRGWLVGKVALERKPAVCVLAGAFAANVPRCLPSSTNLVSEPVSNGSSSASDSAVSAGSLAERLSALHGQEPQEPAAAASNGAPSILPSQLPKLSGTLPQLPRAQGSIWGSRPASSEPAAQAAPTGSAAAPLRTSELISLANVDPEARVKAVSEVQRSTGATVETSRGSTGMTTFLLKGPVADVEKAKAIVQKNLAPRITRQFSIPATSRSIVIGSKGAHLKQVTESTHTKINIGQPTASENETWDLPTVVVEVQGPADAVAAAERQITELVTSRGTAAVATRTPLPTRLVPFVRAHAASIPAVADKSVKVQVSDSGVVVVTGAPTAISGVTENLDSYVSESEADFATKEVDLAQASKFLPKDFLFAEHKVILDGTQLYGLATNLAPAAKALSAYVKSLSIASLDISRSHGRNVSHARRVSRYFADRSLLPKLEEQYKVNITGPTPTAEDSDALVYYITGATADATNAVKKQLIDRVNDITPSKIHAGPGFSSEIGRSHAKAIAGTFSNIHHIIDNDETLLVYVDSDEDFGPSLEETQKALADSAVLLAPAYEVENSIEELKVEIPNADHRYVREPLGSAKGKLAALTGKSEQLPLVHITYGANHVLLRGCKSNVDALAIELPELIESSKDYQKRSNYKEELQFDPKHIRNLIGRNGVTISKIKDDYQVKIDVVESGTVSIKGLESNVKKAKASILELEARLLDEVEEKVTVPQQYHSLLIGLKGKSVRRMKEKYDVHVQFPRSNSPTAGDGETEVDPDVIVLRGPSSGVAKTKQEFKDLIDYEKLHSHVQEIKIPSKTLNRVIGRQGAFINGVKDSTETNIDVSKTPNDDDTVTIAVKGNTKGVKSAIQQIQAAVDAIIDTIEKSIDVDRKYHRYLVGAGNETKKAIIEKAGGQAENNGSHILQIPPSSSGSNTIRIVGPSKIVAAIEQQILDIVSTHEKEERVVDTLVIPTEQSRVLIGPGGTTKRDIESRFSVLIDVPRRDSASTQTTVNVTLKSSSEENITAAKDYITELTQVDRRKIKVPAAIEGDVFNYGILAKRLEEDFGARLSVNRRPVPRSSPDSPAAPSSLSTEQYSFSLQALGPDFAPASGKEVTWSLSSKNGSASDKAEALVNSLIADVQSHNSVGFLWFSKPAYYSQVIGPAGTSINAIRKQTGCVILVPKSGGKNLEPVSIRGTQQQVEEARKLLLEEAGLL